MNKIWIDLDNSPHVPLFRPIIDELNRREIDCVITARDYAQTEYLLRFWNIPYEGIGRHGGKNKLGKIINLFIRAGQLKRYVRNIPISLAVSHGSRTQLVAAKLSGIRSVLMLDYEYTETRIFNYLSDFLLIPKYIPDSRLEAANIYTSKVLRYPGFKEQLYLNSFEPDLDFRKKLDIDNHSILVTIRPSATLGNYHDPVSETIMLKILEKLVSQENVEPLIVSRTNEDKEILRERFGDRINFLERTVDGLQLIWNSDIFISGGGSMNREAALLGVPTYSIFTGRKPYLDEYLSERGRLTFIDSPQKIEQLDIHKRDIPSQFNVDDNHLVEEVVDTILSLR